MRVRKTVAMVGVVGALLGGGCEAILGLHGNEVLDLDGGGGSSMTGTAGAGAGSTTGVGSSSGSASSTTGASSASGAGGAGPFHYTATVADCVDTNAPNPDVCEQSSPPPLGQMRIATITPYHGFLRFDLDKALAGRTVTAVMLYLTTTTDSGAGSDKSGEIWQVSTFDRPSLFMTAPSRVGNKPVAGDLGPVVQSMTYQWSLSTTLVVPNMPLCLELSPLSTDSVRYWNTKGTTPPELVIDVQ